MKKVKELAMSKGFDSADKVGVWKGSTVYEAYFDNSDDASTIGLPQYILEKGDDLRFCDPDETFDIMDSIFEED